MNKLIQKMQCQVIGRKKRMKQTQITKNDHKAVVASLADVGMLFAIEP